jgi:prepilin-type N-terminal cleavage/methylation domain-containing protein
MALTKKTMRSRRQRGMSLVEMLVAIVVLTVGVAGCLAAIPFAIKTNFSNRQQSNSTVLAQMVMEKLLSAPSGVAATSTTDCAGTANTINTTGAAGGGSGASLVAGAVDYSQAAVTGYSMNYTTCGSNGLQMVYDVRWNIQAPTGNVKLLTVSAKLNRAGTLPATIRSMIGTGD